MPPRPNLYEFFLELLTYAVGALLVGIVAIVAIVLYVLAMMKVLNSIKREAERLSNANVTTLQGKRRAEAWWHARFLFALLVGGFMAFFSCFFGPILGLRFGTPPNWSDMFVILPLTAIIAGVLSAILALLSENLLFAIIRLRNFVGLLFLFLLAPLSVEVLVTTVHPRSGVFIPLHYSVFFGVLAGVGSVIVMLRAVQSSRR